MILPKGFRKALKSIDTPSFNPWYDQKKTYCVPKARAYVGDMGYPEIKNPKLGKIIFSDFWDIIEQDYL